MSAEVPFFDEASMRKIKVDHERLKRQIQNLIHASPTRNWDNTPGRTVRTGITATNPKYPRYPEPPDNTFVVQFTDTAIDPVEPGERSITSAKWSSKYVIARTLGGAWIPKNTRVTLVKVSGRRRTYWYILEGPAEFIKFTLKEDRMSDEETSHIAEINDWWGFTETITPEAISNTHYRTGEPFRVWFKSKFFPRAIDGAEGIAVHDATRHRYWVLICDQITTRYRGVATAAVCAAPFAMRDGDVCDFFPFSQDYTRGTGRISQITNDFKLAGRGNPKVMVEWVEKDKGWLATQIEHEEVEVVVDARFNKTYNSETAQTTCKLQKKVNKIWTQRCTDVGEWRDMVPLYSSTVLVALRQSSGTNGAGDPYCWLQGNAKTICTFDNVATQANNWTTYVTYTRDDVLVNLHDDGEYLVGTFRPVFAPCWGSESDSPLIETELCTEETS